LHKHHALALSSTSKSQTYNSPCLRQRKTPSDDENSTPPTPSSPNALNHGRIEVWFEGHEDRIQTFLIEINRKQIILPKWLRVENFGTLEQHLKA